jgi:hypothetical protein
MRLVAGNWTEVFFCQMALYNFSLYERLCPNRPESRRE